MKALSFLILALLFVNCEKINFEYPDGILKPDTFILSKGCSNVFVYQYLDSSKVISVRIRGDKVGLSQKRNDFDLRDLNTNLSVNIEIAGNSTDSVYFNYCSDVAHLNQGKMKKYIANSGKLSISVSEDNPIKNPEWKSRYQATIQLENVVLVNETDSNDEILLDRIVFWDVDVGWMPG